jgi:tetratricopeptide (TPR) repeat protein
MKRLFLTLLLLTALTPLLWADQAMDYYTTGLDLYEHGNYRDSAVILEGVVRSSPDFWQAYGILGHDYVNLGDYQKGIADCEKSLSLHPDNSELKTYTDNLKTLPPPTPTPVGSSASVSTQGNGTTAAPPRADHAPGFFYLGLAGGMDIPRQGWQSAYHSSPGGMLCLGYEFDKNWEVQLELEGFYFSGVNYSGPIFDTELFAIPILRYRFSGLGGIIPYLLAGGGGEFELLSGNSDSPVIDLDAALGAGLEADLGSQSFLFVEGKYNFIFSQQVTGKDIPVLAGIRFGL